jgi:hypothetical protein
MILTIGDDEHNDGKMHAAVPFGMWPWILERAQKQVRTSTKNTTELVPDILSHLLQGPALLHHQ